MNGIVRINPVKHKNRFSMSNRETRKVLFLVSLFALPIINFLVFWLYLNFSALDFAFKVELPGGETVYSLQNFRSLFKSIAMPESTFWQALKNTLLYWFTTSILSYVVALFIGYFLYKRRRGRVSSSSFSICRTLSRPRYSSRCLSRQSRPTGP